MEHNAVRYTAGSMSLPVGLIPQLLIRRKGRPGAPPLAGVLPPSSSVGEGHRPRNSITPAPRTFLTFPLFHFLIFPALRSAALGLILAWTAPAGLGAAEPADPLAAWTFHNGREFPGAEGGIRWNEKEGHVGRGCIEVQFSFEGGGNYVAAMMRMPDVPDARRAHLWLKKPGRNRITFRATDSAGQTFQKFTDYTYPGWQRIEVDLGTWVHSWGGPKDGKVRWPMTAFGVLIENDGDAKRGSYFIDEVEYLPESAEPAPGGLRRSTYVARDFTTDDGWQHANWFPGGRWSYRLTEAGSQHRVGTDFALFGDPKRLRLRVESDGSGHELVISLGSHFQTFERTLGTLTATGEQTFEVATDTLAGWRHYHGENDGVRRLPLRFTGLGLVRKGEPATGSIRLLSLECETVYAPEHTVVMIPDGRLEGDEARFDIVLCNLGEQRAAGNLVTEIRNVAGRLATKEAAIDLPPGARPVRHRLTWPMEPQQAFVEAAFRFLGPNVQSPEASVTVVRTPPAPERPADVNPIGVGIYLYRCQGTADSGRRMRELAAMARHAGVKWTREEIQWHATEPQRGQYRWDFYDDLVKAAGEHGIHVYGLLAYWSVWAHAEEIAYTEAGVREYARWAAQVVRRYKDRIKHWEVWNEPNIFFWSGPKDLYITCLKDTYAAIKKEDPDAQVLGCSTAGIDAPFIKKVVDAGAPFDILTIHPYRGSLNELTFIDELRRTQASVGGRPVWITEMGWPTCIGGTSERQQAGLVARTYLSALASGAVGSVSWYDFRDDGDNPFYNEHRFGLLRSDLRPKAGFRALATIGHRLARHKVAGRIEFDDDVLAFTFQADDEDVLAVWSPDEDRAVRLVRTGPAAGGIRAFDAM